MWLNLSHVLVAGNTGNGLCICLILDNGFLCYKEVLFLVNTLKIWLPLGAMTSYIDKSVEILDTMLGTDRPNVRM